MCDNAIYYNGTQLWTHWDKDISSNTLNFEFFTYQSDKQLKLQAPKFKFVIYSKSTNSSSVTMFNSELYKYIYNVKKVIVDRLNAHIDSINGNKQYTDGFTFKTNRNNIYTTVMYHNLIDAPCIRFMIGEKEQMLVDTDKIYIPLIEFNSLFITMSKAFDNYCVMSQNIMMMDQFKKYNELFEEKMLDLSLKIVGEKVKKTVDELEISSDSLSNMLMSKDEPESEIEECVVCESRSEQQNDFDNFLVNKRDSFELDLGDKEIDKNKEDKKENVNTQKEIIHENFFQYSVLKNDMCNLENMINNCVNSKLPVTSFVNTVYDMSGIDLYNGFEENDKYCLNYAITNNLRHNINLCLSKNVSFPKSINPVIVPDKCNSQEKIDTVCFLILSYIYTSKVKSDLEGIENQIDNKSFLAYSLKTITSPFVFSHILDINKDVMIACVQKLYNDLNKSEFFKNFNQKIYEKLHKNIDFNTKYLTEQLERIYDNVKKFKDKLVIDNFFNKKLMVLDCSDIRSLKNDYDVDIMETILCLEYKKEVKSTDKLSDVILEKYGLKEKKFDNTILIDYIRNNDKNFNDLEQIKKINTSVKDIIDNIDIRNYSVDTLKAIYYWNVKFLPKNITYDKFDYMVKNSSLDKNELISMILHGNYLKDDTFYNSLNIIIND